MVLLFPYNPKNYFMSGRKVEKISPKEFNRILAPKILKLIGHPSEKKFAISWRKESLGTSVFTSIVPTSEHNAQGHSQTPQFKESKARRATPGVSRFIPTEELPDPISVLAQTVADDESLCDFEEHEDEIESDEELVYSDAQIEAEERLQNSTLYLVSVGGVVMLTTNTFISKLFDGKAMPTQKLDAIVYSTAP